METWRLITTWDEEPGRNMALDEAFLVAGGAHPVLRFYSWQPAALSLGYFQRYAEVPQVDRAAAVVRRLTGGGAIHHADELTFSIAAPLAHPLYRGEVRGSYERVHAAIATALARFGVAAAPRGERSLDSDDPASAMCFRRSTPIDLAWDGAKGVGSAQRRRRGRVLHHGSIKLGTTELEGPVARVRDRAPEVERTGLARVLVESFATSFDAHFEESQATPDEEEHARRRARFFTSAEFVRRR